MRILTFCFLLDQVVLCADIVDLYERLQNGYNIKIPGPGQHQEFHPQGSGFGPNRLGQLECTEIKPVKCYEDVKFEILNSH